MKRFEAIACTHRGTLAMSALVAATLAVVLALAGCSVSKPSSFVEASIEGDNVIVPKTQLSENAIYVNYDASGTVVQLLAIKSADGKSHVALNTCQSCNPSPKAYFTQEGDDLTCNNCGLKFSADTVGATNASSCNPTPIQGLTETDEAFVIPIATLDAYAPLFESWQGPTK